MFVTDEKKHWTLFKWHCSASFPETSPLRVIEDQLWFVKKNHKWFYVKYSWVTPKKVLLLQSYSLFLGFCRLSTQLHVSEPIFCCVVQKVTLLKIASFCQKDRVWGFERSVHWCKRIRAPQNRALHNSTAIYPHLLSWFVSRRMTTIFSFLDDCYSKDGIGSKTCPVKRQTVFLLALKMATSAKATPPMATDRKMGWANC